jgi:hypothetical protein
MVKKTRKKKMVGNITVILVKVLTKDENEENITIHSERFTIKLSNNESLRQDNPLGFVLNHGE